MKILNGLLMNLSTPPVACPLPDKAKARARNQYLTAAMASILRKMRADRDDPDGTQHFQYASG
jgi:hypothetical protein